MRQSPLLQVSHARVIAVRSMLDQSGLPFPVGPDPWIRGYRYRLLEGDGMTWQKGLVVEKPKKFERIHCFTCKQDLATKRVLKSHLGHDVHYVKKDGTIDE